MRAANGKMFCHQCGSKNESSAKFCSNCGSAITQPPQNTDLQAANESLKREIANQKKFMPALGELPIIDNDRAAYFKSTINVDWGRAHLTTHRIVFCGESGNFFKLMVSPALAVMTSSALPKIHFQILLDDIERIEYKPKGLKSGFFISSKQGKVHRIAFTKNSEWEIGLAKYMK